MVSRGRGAGSYADMPEQDAGDSLSSALWVRVLVQQYAMRSNHQRYVSGNAGLKVVAGYRNVLKLHEKL